MSDENDNATYRQRLAELIAAQVREQLQGMSARPNGGVYSTLGAIGEDEKKCENKDCHHRHARFSCEDDDSENHSEDDDDEEGDDDEEESEDEYDDNLEMLADLITAHLKLVRMLEKCMLSESER